MTTRIAPTSVSPERHQEGQPRRDATPDPSTAAAAPAHRSFRLTASGPWSRLILVPAIILAGSALLFLVGMIALAMLVRPTPSAVASAPSAANQLVQLPGLDTYQSPLVSRTPADLADELGVLINREREGAGVAPLERSTVLDASAAAKLDHLIAHDYWAHDSPDGVTPWVFFDDAGYRYIEAGENLAKDYLSPGSLVQGWMHSPTHRETMLHARFTEMGLAVDTHASGDSSGMIVVAHFALPGL